jgi:uncharacterized protein (TIGR01777 family)
MRVFVTGGTGLIGLRLVHKLIGRGDQVVVLTRRYAAARQMLGPECNLSEGDPTQPGEWMSTLADCDAVVNLVGENIFARRWRSKFKDLLFTSRVTSTQNVVQAMSQKSAHTGSRPKVLVNASAIGYYGVHGDEELSEGSPPDADFMANICVEWEKVARAAESFGTRCVVVRIGVVLDRQGGALAKMLTPFKLFVGGPVGNGRQWMSWIHHEDMTGLLLLALDRNDATGPLNATAPNPVTNRDFSKALGRALHRPAFLPTPRFALRFGLGEVANVITTGQRVLPKRALGLGYQFQYPTIEAALQQLFAQPA